MAYEPPAAPIDLAMFDEGYKATEAAKGRGDVPDGTYQVITDAVYLRAAKTTSAPMLAWQLRIISGDQSGRMIFHNSMIRDAENPAKFNRFTKGELETVGFKGKPSELSTDAGREKLLNVCLEVKQVTKPAKAGSKYDENKNVYFQNRIDVDPAAIPAKKPGGNGAGGTAVAAVGVDADGNPLPF